MDASVLALECARPRAAWALLLPVLLLLVLRTAARPPRVVLGTLELWRGVAAASATDGGARARMEPWALACALGLLLGALAWLGPRAGRADPVRTWTCVVDRSPSMGFSAGADPRPSRLDAALESALAWLARASGPGDRVRWLAPGRLPLELARDRRPENAWLAPDAERGGEPEWALHDRPGVLWISDREPAVPHAYAGLFASGGPAVPGPIAADGRTTWIWEGGELRALANTHARAVRVQEASGRTLPAVLQRVLAAWCGARGFELARETTAEILLLIELLPESGGDEELLLERDGWRASARGALPGEGAHAEFGESGEDWLVGRTRAGGSYPVVRVEAGRIQVGLRELSEPSGDPALFALSWARLFDRAARPPAGVVALAERQAAGEPLVAPGVLAGPNADAGVDLGPTLDALLALGALLCALVSWRLLARARAASGALG